MKHAGLRLWRFPVLYRGIIKDVSCEGLNISVRKHYGWFQMERHARKFLRPCPIDTSLPPVGQVNYLAGYTHAYQTAFGACSLQLVCPEPVHIVVHDDGTLDEGTSEYLHRILPCLTIRSARHNEERAADYLPPSRFPTLWNVRSRFVLMRKLIDVHGSEPGWKMFLDSDMLFWREPVALLKWLRQPNRPCCMVDVKTSYGYTDEALSTCLGGRPVEEFLNTGMCGLNRESVDWERLEYWCADLTKNFGINHFLEQALVALLFSETDHFKFPRRDYITCPIRDQIFPTPEGVMHHYVADSRKFLYMDTWRDVNCRLNEACARGVLPKYSVSVAH